jgi:hypothetical protein
MRAALSLKLPLPMSMILDGDPGSLHQSRSELTATLFGNPTTALDLAGSMDTCPKPCIAHELRNEMRGSPVSSLGAFRPKILYNERYRREK